MSQSFPTSAAYSPTEIPGSEKGPEDDKPRRGCLFYGCLTAVIVLIIFVVAMVALFLALREGVTGMIRDISEEEKRPLPVIALDEEQTEDLEARLEAYGKAVENQEATTLRLTGPELTFFVNRQLREFFEIDEDLVAIEFVDGQLKGVIALPVRILTEIPGLNWFIDDSDEMGSRYVNAEADLEVSVEDGQLRLRLVAMRSKGEPVEDQILEGFREGFASTVNNINNDPDTQDAFERVSSLTIEGNEMIIVLRGEEEPEAEGDTAEGPAESGGAMDESSEGKAEAEAGEPTESDVTPDSSEGTTEGPDSESSTDEAEAPVESNGPESESDDGSGSSPEASEPPASAFAA